MQAAFMTFEESRAHEAHIVEAHSSFSVESIDFQLVERFTSEDDTTNLSAAANFEVTRVGYYDVNLVNALGNERPVCNIIVLDDNGNFYLIPTNFDKVVNARAYILEATTAPTIQTIQTTIPTLSAKPEDRLAMVHNLFTTAYQALGIDLELANTLMEAIKKQYIICGVPYTACNALPTQLDVLLSSFSTFEDMVSKGTCQNNEAV